MTDSTIHNHKTIFFHPYLIFRQTQQVWSNLMQIPTRLLAPCRYLFATRQFGVRMELHRICCESIHYIIITVWCLKFPSWVKYMWLNWVKLTSCWFYCWFDMIFILFNVCVVNYILSIATHQSCITLFFIILNFCNLTKKKMKMI